MSHITSENSSPGFIESVASSRRKTKENIRVDQLIPSEILESAEALKTLLEKYYEFMNLREFIYQKTESFDDIILDNRARFRIPDPLNKNNRFFTDENGANSTMVITDVDGSVTNYTLTATNVAISNGNDLPGTLADSTSEIGKTLTVTGLDAYNGQTATITTIVKYWAGPGPSWAMNTIEDALDIDLAEDNYLQLIQREIASFIPRSLPVDRRALYKALVQYYKIRGSQDSIEIFFRLLFNDEVTVDYPYNKTLVPSSGNWDSDLNQYLDKRGQLSNNTNFLHDSYYYQRFSYLIRTGQNITAWKNVYNRLVHPAGFQFFGEILININLLRDELGDNTKGFTQDKYGPDQFVNVYPSFGRVTLSSMPGIQPGLIGEEDLPLLVESFAKEYLPFIYAESHASASISLSLSGGQITGVEILSPGWGYQSAPTITVSGIAFSGQTITDAVLTATIDEVGRVDSVTITNPGANYSAAAGTVAANPSFGTISNIYIGGMSYNEYREPPTIIFSQPTQTDSEGVLLPTNAVAQAEFSLYETGIQSVNITNGGRGYSSVPTVTFSAPDNPGVTAEGVCTLNNGRVEGVRIYNQGSGYTKTPTVTFSGGSPDVTATGDVYLVPSQIESISITNAGSGYIEQPIVKLNSSAVNEQRAKDTVMELVLLLNMIDNAEVLNSNNNYFSLTETNVRDTPTQLLKNQPIEMWGNLAIVGDSVINNYNTSTFVQIK